MYVAMRKIFYELSVTTTKENDIFKAECYMKILINPT